MKLDDIPRILFEEFVNPVPQVGGIIKTGDDPPTGQRFWAGGFSLQPATEKQRADVFAPQSRFRWVTYRDPEPQNTDARIGAVFQIVDSVSSAKKLLPVDSLETFGPTLQLQIDVHYSRNGYGGECWEKGKGSLLHECLRFDRGQFNEKFHVLSRIDDLPWFQSILQVMNRATELAQKVTALCHWQYEQDPCRDYSVKPDHVNC